MKTYQKLLLIFSITLGFLVRLYKINSPVADWHSHRQADTASVTKNLTYKTGTFFIPTYHDISNIQSNLDNPNGYRMVELPIYNIICANLHQILKSISPQFTIEISSRLVSILFSILTSYILFLFVKKYSSQFWPAFLSLLVFLFLPFNIYYSRTILPEPTAIFFMLFSLYLFEKNLIISGLALSIAILIKPFTIIVAFPILLVLGLKKYKSKLNKKTIFHFLVFTLISLIPFLLWQKWIQNFPQGIPYNKWLFIKQRKFLSENNWKPNPESGFVESLIPFKPYWFRWLFTERLAKLILGTFGIIPFFLGLIYKKRHIQKISFAALFGICLYFIIIAGGNIQHDYYQFLISPLISLIVGLGLFYIANYTFKNKLVAISSALLLFTISIFTSHYQTKEYYKINNQVILEAGQKANQTLPQDALVIAPYTGDTAFLYQTNRSGWPTEIYDVKNITTQHPHNPVYLVSVNFDDYTNQMMKLYPTIYQTDKFIILEIYSP
ncbi:glycosyltransferase family 39 protein [Patescibacteria group bacterium]|nr:glycosyltransferase family 39 protein [Patescibacteria group bacterium]MCG2702129.1 glycosyltransferase family 39 protein [Candidatus Parcubacteria bacterium]MBU4265076.1 glycosyltransferase family 39 protein [Patescibacteria group bacterium]MBU4389684.1 glycosyltransferase family 39 protein [Patescibacteria group bacterium]MBU4397195.1 glycosyltransferase family 39 protein [Patescibacteria group bacterium]